MVLGTGAGGVPGSWLKEVETCSADGTSPFEKANYGFKEEIRAVIFQEIREWRRIQWNGGRKELGIHIWKI